MTRQQITNLITGYRKKLKGWHLPDYNQTKEKAMPTNIDLAFYDWYNTKTGEGYICNRHQFKQLTNLKQQSINKLVAKERNSLFGWVVTKLPKQE